MSGRVKKYISSNLEEVGHQAQLSILAKQRFWVEKGIFIVDVTEVVTENNKFLVIVKTELEVA